MTDKNKKVDQQLTNETEAPLNTRLHKAVFKIPIAYHKERDKKIKHDGIPNIPISADDQFIREMLQKFIWEADLELLKQHFNVEVFDPNGKYAMKLIKISNSCEPMSVKEIADLEIMRELSKEGTILYFAKKLL